MKKEVSDNKKVNKIWFIIILLLLLIVLLLNIAWGLFSGKDKDSSTIRVGEIKVELVEDWPEIGEEYNNEEYDEFGINLTEKNIKGVSTGTVPAYVRIKCVPIVEYYDTATSKWLVAAVEAGDVVVWIEGDSWISSNNYYYYDSILEATEETDELGIKWRLTETPSFLSNYDVRVNVRVSLEYAQATSGAWKEVFQINELPTGVEAFVEKAIEE